MRHSPQGILESLGYDSFGNNEKLLAAADRELIDNGQYERVSQESICPKCSYPYHQHPPVQGALWLTRGCDQLIKL